MRALMWILVALGIILGLIGVSANAVLGTQFAAMGGLCVLVAIFMSTREPVQPK